MNSTCHFEAPDFAALDTLARRPEPFVLWPVGPQSLLAHWMDAAVARGARRVRILAQDRPTLVRDFFAVFDYWSCAVEVLSSRPADWPSGAEVLDHLPAHDHPAPPGDPAALVQRWFELNLTWVRHRPADRLSIDRRHPTGGWIGPRARIHPSAILTPPFWIGARAEIGARTQIGPDGIVGESCVVDADAEIVGGAALAGTYVGQHVALRDKLADGGILLDIRRGSRIEIGEDFILSALEPARARPGLGERALALALALLGSLLTWRHGRDTQTEQVLTHRSADVSLATGLRGPLLVRRRHWLYRVVGGDWHLVGLLPRTAAAVTGTAPDVRDALLRAPVGVFSLADVHGCHRPGEGEEWIHALFQAVPAGAGSNRIVWLKLWELAWSTP